MAAARSRATVLTNLAMAVLLLLYLQSTTSAQVVVDCSTEFNDLQPCLDFVTSTTLTTPSKPCCAAFEATEVHNPVCLCQLQQAFADPAKSPGNATRANAIPNLCAVAVDPSRCPALMGLVPSAAPVAPVAAPPSPKMVAPAPAPRGADFDCSEQFNSLAICIAYISSNETAPPPECCAALLTVHLKTPVCLCQLLAQVNDPTVTTGLNVTKAIDLPNMCKIGTDSKRCPALLGEPVASPLPGPVEGPSPVASPVTVPVGVPDEGAIIGLPPSLPGTTPAVTTPTRNDANGATIPFAILAGSVISSLWVAHF